MNNRLASAAEFWLNFVKDNPGSLSQIAYRFKIPPTEIAPYLVLLFNRKFLTYSLPGVNFKNNAILLNEPLNVTLEGLAYLENVKRDVQKEKRQFYINLINGIAAGTALIKSFWSEIISVMQQLTQQLK